MLAHHTRPDLSLIVCTRNRGMQLRRCLECIRQQDYAPTRWELIIVDNGSTDDTAFAVQEFARSVPFETQLVDEPTRGLARARNAGVAAARAPLLAFTDDDCYVARDFVRAIVEQFQRHGEGCGYIGGRILLHDPTDAPETIETREEPREIQSRTVFAPGTLHGANMAFRRSLFDALEGFDPWFSLSCEDAEFLGRASMAGFRGAYRPEPTVWHHHGRKSGRDITILRRRYASGRGAYYLKGCLNHQTRPAFMRHWYWQMRWHLRRRRPAEILYELTGAAGYLRRFVMQPR